MAFLEAVFLKRQPGDDLPLRQGASLLQLLKPVLISVLFPLLVLAGWELGVRSGVIGGRLMPPPSRVLTALSSLAAEFMGASEGLGYLLVDGQQLGKPDQIIAAILVFALVGKVTDTVLLLCSAPFLAWQDTHQGKR